MNSMLKDKLGTPSGAVQKKPEADRGGASSSAALRGKSYDEQVQMMVPPGAPVQRDAAPGAAPAPTRPTLRKGAKGPDVITLQRMLNSAGATPPLVDDGDFGEKTRLAVVAFQGGNKNAKGEPLGTDGVVGPATWGALDAKGGGGGATTPGGGGGNTTTPGGGGNTTTPGGGGNTTTPGGGGNTTTPGGGGTTTPGGGGGAPGGGAAATLSNPMFAGDPKLTEVIQGKTTIKSGSGAHIKKVQTGLMNLGYNMPIFGADGSWGKEMVEALGQFQAQSVGARSGVLDQPTMAALDKSAPAAAVEKTLRYGELFKDGLLDFTVGVGYDEDGYFDSEIDEIREGMGSQLGLAEASASDAAKLYQKAGMPVPSSGGGEYFIKEAAFEYNGQPINVLVRLVTYKDPEAKKAFLEAMQNSDASIYTGHGRYGSGPDFDHKTKGEGNIWVNPDQTVKDSGTAGMYDKLEHGGAKKNELQNISFDKKYKVWFFDGCNTSHYLRPIRQNKTIDPNKTDTFGWGDEISTSTTDVDVLMFVQSLMKQKSAQQIIKDLNKANNVTDAKHGLHGEGLGDNPNA